MFHVCKQRDLGAEKQTIFLGATHSLPLPRHGSVYLTAGINGRSGGTIIHFHGSKRNNSKQTTNDDSRAIRSTASRQLKWHLLSRLSVISHISTCQSADQLVEQENLPPGSAPWRAIFSMIDKWIYIDIRRRDGFVCVYSHCLFVYRCLAKCL